MVDLKISSSGSGFVTFLSPRKVFDVLLANEYWSSLSQSDFEPLNSEVIDIIFRVAKHMRWLGGAHHWKFVAAVINIALCSRQPHQEVSSEDVYKVFKKSHSPVIFSRWYEQAEVLDPRDAVRSRTIRDKKNRLRFLVNELNVSPVSISPLVPLEKRQEHRASSNWIWHNETPKSPPTHLQSFYPPSRTAEHWRQYTA